MNNDTTLDNKLHWYKDAVIYELHIKAFRDGNGDGIGDFEGLLQKLDYLQGLGVTAIWLLPFYPSPLRDDGYDIADYYTINPAYGDLEQFKKFLEEAHRRKLKVITELVINHTSDQHPWFQRARRAPKDSAERNYYVWTDDPQQFKDARIIFQDFEASNWTWDPIAQQYYWHRFFHHQPDLNYDSAEVQDEVFKILEYWCAMGVDGFRLDAVPYLFERDDTNCENLPETHAFLKKLRSHVDATYPGTLLLAEANMWPEDSAHYFGNGDECQMNYHFPIMPRMFMALQMEDRYPIVDILNQTPAIPETCQWAIFLRNHDELTLEMVTDEERDYMYKVYVKDPRARINLGIRHRLAPLMDNNRRKIELMNYLLFSLPGTPVIYYGDEIGMGDNYYLGDRDGVRTPMQWSADRNAGFSEANPQQLYLPVILDPLYHYESVNVDIENKNTSSLLWAMRRMINTRKKHKAFSRGDIKFINTDNSKILAFTRTYQDEIMLVIVNLSRFKQPVELDLSAYAGHKLTEIFSNNNFPAVKGDGPYLFTVSQYDCLWFMMKPETENTQLETTGLPTIELTEWQDITGEYVTADIENNALPGYLQKMRWFGGKARAIDNIKITDHAAIDAQGTEVILWLIETTYKTGLPDMYQLAVAFADDKAAIAIKEASPNAVICDMKIGEQTGILYDAIYSTGFQQAIIANMAANNTVAHDKTTIQFSGSEQLGNYVKEHRNIRSRVLSAEQSNSSVVYDSAFFLKLYRKVDYSINPDLEITRFLTEQTNFKHIPAYTGNIARKSAKGTVYLGMMQEMVENNTDGWSFMLDSLKSYNEKILAGGELSNLFSESAEIIPDASAPDNLHEDMEELLETTVIARVKTLGIRTGELHLALASSNDAPDFKPEPYSLHYQRSLFASFQTLVQRTFQTLEHSMESLPETIKAEAEEVLKVKDAILERFKKVYDKKIDTIKIRNHGDYHLGQTLFTGNDIEIIDFEGEPARSYSERRLKRSGLRDVAGMVRSFHYAAYASLFLNNSLHKNDVQKLTPYVEQWQRYMNGFYLQAYLETVKDSLIVPANKEDLAVLLEAFVLEKAVYELNYELNNRPDWVMIPIRGIKAIMRQQ